MAAGEGLYLRPSPTENVAPAPLSRLGGGLLPPRLLRLTSTIRGYFSLEPLPLIAMQEAVMKRDELRDELYRAAKEALEEADFVTVDEARQMVEDRISKASFSKTPETIRQQAERVATEHANADVEEIEAVISAAIEEAKGNGTPRDISGSDVSLEDGVTLGDLEEELPSDLAEAVRANLAKSKGRDGYLTAQGEIGYAELAEELDLSGVPEADAESPDIEWMAEALYE